MQFPARKASCPTSTYLSKSSKRLAFYFFLNVVLVSKSKIAGKVSDLVIIASSSAIVSVQILPPLV